MIQFDDVSLGFSGHKLFKGATFAIQKGERCGFVGRNGSGKSTVLRLITGELESDSGNISLGKHYRIGYLQQHIHFTKPTLLEEAALGLRHEEKDMLYKAEKILFGLGFNEEDLSKDPATFSGGFHLRLHLAKVLVSEPDCLLLDEPTNYLDILSIRWLTGFLRSWKGEFILISHDRDFMDSVSTHTLGIHREKIKKIKGSSIDLFQQIVLEEEVHEKTRVKSEKKRAHLQSFIDRFGAKATKAGQAQSKKKILDREPILEELNKIFNLSFSFQEAPFPGQKIVEAKNLKFSYTQDTLIHDCSIEIEKGERIAIIGKNGRGKSTILRLIGTDLSPQEGTVKFSDNGRIGYFGQTHVERLNKQHTIAEEIALANQKLSYTEVKGIAGLMMFGGDLSDKKISVLSGGEKSRVLLGKIIATPCNLLLLDEPTHHLDIESIEALIDALEDFTGAVVIVTHSELILRRLALDKIIVCEEGKQTLFLGGYDDFLEKMGWQEEKKGQTSSKSQADNRKERADKVNKRAGALNPIKKQIEDCENKIHKLEKEQKQNTALLEKGDISTELLKTIAMKKDEIEQLETKLYALYEEQEKIKSEYN